VVNSGHHNTKLALRKQAFLPRHILAFVLSLKVDLSGPHAADFIIAL
jgi:hypothetical protein